MTQESPPVISIVGRSKTGKTTVIERVIPLIRERGLRIAVIKHHHRDFDMDIPGKDTYRHKAAGASMVVISSPAKLALVEDTEEDLLPREIVSRYVHDVDLVIIEGFKWADYPKMEVFSLSRSPEPVCLGDPNLLAVITDESFETTLPLFRRDDVGDIADFIVSRMIRKAS